MVGSSTLNPKPYMVGFVVSSILSSFRQILNPKPIPNSTPTEFTEAIDAGSKNRFRVQGLGFRVQGLGFRVLLSVGFCLNAADSQPKASRALTVNLGPRP